MSDCLWKGIFAPCWFRVVWRWGNLDVLCFCPLSWLSAMLAYWSWYVTASFRVKINLLTIKNRRPFFLKASSEFCCCAMFWWCICLVCLVWHWIDQVICCLCCLLHLDYLLLKPIILLICLILYSLLSSWRNQESTCFPLASRISSSPV